MIIMRISVLWICPMALMFYSQTILASGETKAFADLKSPNCTCTDNRVDDIICALVNLNPPLAYHCPTSNICILNAWIMDGKIDCPGGEDENCTIVGSLNGKGCKVTTITATIASTINPPTSVQTTMLTTNVATITKPTTSFVTCRATGDPHFTTFDGTYYSPQPPPGSWFLAAEPIAIPNGTISWSVWFTTSDCNPSRGARCILQVEIDIEDQVVVFGINGYFRINSLNVIAPWYYPSKENATVWVVNYGSAGHTLNSINREVSVTYDGAYSMQMQIPLNLYFNKTQGVCGNSNSNPNDDASCPDGGNIDTCWDRYPTSTVSPTTAHTVQPYTATTTKTANHATCDNKMQQEIDLQCTIITNKVGPFSVCAVKAADLTMGYYLSCSYDLCYATNASDAICTLLQSFADVCMQVIPNTILQWRSANFCPQICPKNSHYETCASSCPATCSDMNASTNCKFPCRGDCTCDSGYIQDNGVCIRPELCGCRDSAGYYHLSNSTWVTNDCKENCSCGTNHTVNCHSKTPCDFHATCAIHDGKRNCYCLDGYTGDGEICQSIISTTNVATTTKPNTSLVICLAQGDPHFMTFDGAIISPQEPPEKWFLAAEPVTAPNGTIPWSVWFNTIDFVKPTTLISQLEIDIENQVVVFGTNGYFRVNSLNVIAPWYYPSKENATVWVVNYGSAGHTLNSINREVSVTYDGAHFMQIQIPFNLYFNKTRGICGNYNGDPHDDALCPDGGNMDTCWDRNPNSTVSPTTAHTVQLYTATTTVTANHTMCDNKMQQEINLQCAIITNKVGPFSTCAVKAAELAKGYYLSCSYDLCYATNASDTICTLLQSFADVCMQVIPNTILQWRSANFCPQICPKNSHYETCVSSCPPTCSDTNASANCKFPCRGDCTCDTSFIQENGVYIRPELCGCRDSAGYYHQSNSTWVTNDCKENCSCGANHTVNCYSKTLCNVHATCTVRDGKRNCYCLDGYTGDGEICQLITSTTNIATTTNPTTSFVTCRATGDPHFTTFDGTYYSPQPPPGSWFLAAEPIAIPNGTISWSVWFTTSYCNPSRGARCILQVQIDIEDQVVVFGINGYFRVNSLNVVAPWYYPSKGNATVWVVNYGSAGHTLNSINREVSVTYDGAYSMQMQIPLNVYFNKTQGVCGNSNSNPNDDASCPDGGNIDTCWNRYPISSVSPTTAHTVQPYTATTTKTANYATCDNKTQQEINLQCAIITNKVGPFAVCAIKSAELAMGYYLSCSYDLCYATNASDAICTLLQSFADVCMQVVPNTILQWRSANFCPQICPKNSHYETCASSCPATCSDTNASANCKFSCRGDCTCDSSFIQENGVCIRPELCGCRDSAGYYHQSNSTWVTNDCKENCSCGANHTVNCYSKTLCNVHATCTVRDGKRNCYCLDGYTGDGEICQSITSTTSIQTTTNPTTSFVTCRALGDPHFTTFDGIYYSPQQPPGLWYLAAEPITVSNGTIPWSVWFTTNVYSANGLATRIAQVEIDIDGQVVVIGTDSNLRVNSLNVIAPWYYPSKENATFWVVNYGSAGHTLTTINSVSVTFDGIYSLQIQIPLSYLYFKNTHGFCGTYNSDPYDDITCPDGVNLFCWERKQPAAVSPATSLTRTTIKTASYSFCNKTAEQEISINQMCSIFISKDGPFASCYTGNLLSDLAVVYKFSCTYDLCYSANVSNDICALLQSFADACMQVLPKTVLQWRNASFCPQICPQNSHYETCASSCPATCSDTNAPANCKFPCRGDCTCNSGYILDNGVCIRPELCGCRDSTGYYHQLSSTWVTNDCNENCSCGANYTVNCRRKTPCNPHAHCAVQDGNRNCYCLDGYTGDGETCQPTAMVPLATTTAIMTMPTSIAQTKTTMSTKLLTTTTIPTTTGIFCTWRYLGCYGSVPWDAAMLINGYDFIRPANLTLDSCQAYCLQTYKYKFISLNYGMDCHCGIGLSPNSTKGEEKGCYMTCPGNKQQFCGGPWCYSVYECR